MRTADSPSTPVNGHREADPAGPFRAQQATFKMKEATNWGRLTELLAGYIRQPLYFTPLAGPKAVRDTTWSRCISHPR
jgi:hypothetical protein